MDYAICDYEPDDDLAEVGDAECAWRILRHLKQGVAELGMIAFFESASPLWLITTGFGVEDSSEPFVPLFWVRRLYYYKEECAVMRVSWVPVRGPVGPMDLPPFPKNQDRMFEFSFHEAEVSRSLVLLAKTVIESATKHDFPPHQRDWWNSAGLRFEVKLEQPLVLESKDFNPYVWTVRARKAIG